MTIEGYTVKVKGGKFNKLDKQYRDFIRKHIITNNSYEARLETYEMFVTEVLQLGNEEIFEQLKYRVTDGEDINKVIVDMVEYEIEPTHTLQVITNKLKEYIDIDWLKQYYI